MNAVFAGRTSPTLLGRLRQDPTDQTAWKEFVCHYGPKIHGWCRHWRLQDADAEEVTQNVLLRLAEKMRDFQYDPTLRFRSWLKTLARYALIDYLEKKKKAISGSGDSQVVVLLEGMEAREDLLAKLEAEFDLELLEEAVQRVRLKVSPEKWEVYRLMEMEQLSGAEAAAKVGMKVSTAFVVRSKVQKLLEETVRKLEAGK